MKTCNGGCCSYKFFRRSNPGCSYDGYCDYQCPKDGREKEVSKELFNIVTDNGRLKPIHFQTWAKAIEEKQGYEDSEETSMLKRVAAVIDRLMVRCSYNAEEEIKE